MRDNAKTDQVMKEEYDTPKCASHNPLEIMSKYEDKSSDLPGI